MKRQVEAIMPTDWGNFKMIAYANDADEPMPHLAMAHEHFDPNTPTLVRIHSECMTGDLFHSQRCDCGEQLNQAMQLAAKEGGVVIYLRQEGRGIGLINKLHAYNLQDKGLNTVDANAHLGLEIDARDYGIAIEMLQDLGIHQIHLLTNNPLKIDAIDQSGIEVLSRRALVISPSANNRKYMKTKQDEMGHLYEID